uniref:Uncharacterized protein n=1 Tax=viral metagenome TaxID=1070528 RepID=A0A6M3K7F4_9ZZZZ
MAKKELDIEIKARNLSQQGFSSAAQSAQKFKGDVDKGMGGFASSVTEKLSKIKAYFGAASAGLKSVVAITAMWNGETEKAHEILKSLPLRIGPLYSALYDVLGVLTGINEEIEKTKKLMKDNAEEARRNQASVAQSMSLKERTAATREATGMIGTEGKDREIQSLRNTRDAHLREINRIEEEAYKKYGEDSPAYRGVMADVESYSTAFGQQMVAQRAAIEAKYKDKAEAEEKAANKEAKEIAKRNADNFAAAQKDAEAQARHEVGLETEVAALRLEAQGKNHEAAILRIRQQAAELRAVAKTEREKELIDKLSMAAVAKSQKEEGDVIAKRNKDQFDALRKAAEARARYEADLETEVAARRMEAQGKGHEAELLRIRHAADERLAAAKTGRERENIEALRDMDIADAQKRAGQSRMAGRGVSGVSLTNRFRGLSEVFASRAQITPEQKAIGQRDVQIAEAKRGNEKLDKAVAAMNRVADVMGGWGIPLGVG